MPIYEYECTNCGHRFEELVFSKSDIDPQCPKCKAKNTKRLMSATSFSTSGSSFSGSHSGLKGGCSAPSGSPFS